MEQGQENGALNETWMRGKERLISREGEREEKNERKEGHT